MNDKWSTDLGRDYAALSRLFQEFELAAREAAPDPAILPPAPALQDGLTLANPAIRWDRPRVPTQHAQHLSGRIDAAFQERFADTERSVFGTLHLARCAELSETQLWQGAGGLTRAVLAGADMGSRIHRGLDGGLNAIHPALGHAMRRILGPPGPAPTGCDYASQALLCAIAFARLGLFCGAQIAGWAARGAGYAAGTLRGLGHVAAAEIVARFGGEGLAVMGHTIPMRPLTASLSGIVNADESIIGIHELQGASSSDSVGLMVETIGAAMRWSDLPLPAAAKTAMASLLPNMSLLGGFCRQVDAIGQSWACTEGQKHKWMPAVRAAAARMLAAVEALPPSQSLLLPAGFFHLRGGHGMVLEVERLNMETVQLHLINTGLGSNSHREVRCAGKQKVAAARVWRAPLAAIIAAEFLTSLVRLNVQAVESGSGDNARRKRVSQIYALFCRADFIEQPSRRNPATPQRSGSCSWRSLLAVVGEALPAMARKRVMLTMRLQTVLAHAHTIAGRGSLPWAEVEVFVAAVENLRRKTDKLLTNAQAPMAPTAQEAEALLNLVGRLEALAVEARAAALPVRHAQAHLDVQPPPRDPEVRPAAAAADGPLAPLAAPTTAAAAPGFLRAAMMQAQSLRDLRAHAACRLVEAAATAAFELSAAGEQSLPSQCLPFVDALFCDYLTAAAVAGRSVATRLATLIRLGTVAEATARSVLPADLPIAFPWAQLIVAAIGDRLSPEHLVPTADLSALCARLRPVRQRPYPMPMVSRLDREDDVWRQLEPKQPCEPKRIRGRAKFFGNSDNYDRPQEAYGTLRKLWMCTWAAVAYDIGTCLHTLDEPGRFPRRGRTTPLIQVPTSDDTLGRLALATHATHRIDRSPQACRRTPHTDSENSLGRLSKDDVLSGRRSAEALIHRRPGAVAMAYVAPWLAIMALEQDAARALASHEERQRWVDALFARSHAPFDHHPSASLYKPIEAGEVELNLGGGFANKAYGRAWSMPVIGEDAQLASQALAALAQAVGAAPKEALSTLAEAGCALCALHGRASAPPSVLEATCALADAWAARARAQRCSLAEVATGLLAFRAVRPACSLDTLLDQVLVDLLAAASGQPDCLSDDLLELAGQARARLGAILAQGLQQAAQCQRILTCWERACRLSGVAGLEGLGAWRQVSPGRLAAGTASFDLATCQLAWKGCFVGDRLPEEVASDSLFMAVVGHRARKVTWQGSSLARLQDGFAVELLPSGGFDLWVERELWPLAEARARPAARYRCIRDVHWVPPALMEGALLWCDGGAPEPARWVITNFDLEPRAFWAGTWCRMPLQGGGATARRGDCLRLAKASDRSLAFEAMAACDRVLIWHGPAGQQVAELVDYALMFTRVQAGRWVSTRPGWGHVAPARGVPLCPGLPHLVLEAERGEARVIIGAALPPTKPSLATRGQLLPSLLDVQPNALGARVHRANVGLIVGRVVDGHVRAQGADDNLSLALLHLTAGHLIAAQRSLQAAERAGLPSPHSLALEALLNPRAIAQIGADRWGLAAQAAFLASSHLPVADAQEEAIRLTVAAYNQVATNVCWPHRLTSEQAAWLGRRLGMPVVGVAEKGATPLAQLRPPTLSPAAPLLGASLANRASSMAADDLAETRRMLQTWLVAADVAREDLGRLLYSTLSEASSLGLADRVGPAADATALWPVTPSAMVHAHLRGRLDRLWDPIAAIGAQAKDRLRGAVERLIGAHRRGAQAKGALGLLAKLAGAAPGPRRLWQGQLAAALVAPDVGGAASWLAAWEMGAGRRLRAEQVEALAALFAEGGGVVAQLPMGFGKTKVLLPLLCLLHAESGRLPVVVVPEASFALNAQDLAQTALAGAGQRVHAVAVDRRDLDDPRRLGWLADLLEHAHAHRQAIITTPGSLITLALAFEALCLKEDDATVQPAAVALRRILKHLAAHGVGLVDEIHHALDVRHEVNFAQGRAQPLAACQKEAAATFFAVAAAQWPACPLARLGEGGADDLPAVLRGWAQQVACRLVNAGQAGPASARELADVLAAGADSGWVDRLVREDADRVRVCIALLATYLPAMRHRRAGEHFGRHSEDFATPFAACRPVIGAHFANPMETLVATYLSYLHHPPTKEEVGRGLQGLLAAARKQAADDPGLTPLSCPKGQTCLHLAGQGQAARACLTNGGEPSPPLIDEVVAHLRADPQHVLAWVMEAVAPSIQTASMRLGANGFDLCRLFARVDGFTGTSWNACVYPPALKMVHPRHASELPPAITSCTQVVHPAGRRLDAVMAAGLAAVRPPGKAHALMDVAAVFRDHASEAVAEQILQLAGNPAYRGLQHVQHVLFFDAQGHPAIKSMGEGAAGRLPVIGSDLAELTEMGKDPEAMFTFYDQSHCLGTDVPQPLHAWGLLTTCDDSLKHAVAQGAHRLRRLGEDQRLVVAHLGQPVQGGDELAERIEGNERRQLGEDLLLGHLRLSEAQQRSALRTAMLQHPGSIRAEARRVAGEIWVQRHNFQPRAELEALTRLPTGTLLAQARQAWQSRQRRLGRPLDEPMGLESRLKEADILPLCAHRGLVGSGQQVKVEVAQQQALRTEADHFRPPKPFGGNLLKPVSKSELAAYFCWGTGPARLPLAEAWPAAKGLVEDNLFVSCDFALVRVGDRAEDNLGSDLRQKAPGFILRTPGSRPYTASYTLLSHTEASLLLFDANNCLGPRVQLLNPAAQLLGIDGRHLKAYGSWKSQQPPVDAELWASIVQLQLVAKVVYGRWYLPPGPAQEALVRWRQGGADKSDLQQKRQRLIAEACPQQLAVGLV